LAYGQTGSGKTFTMEGDSTPTTTTTTTTAPPGDDDGETAAAKGEGEGEEVGEEEEEGETSTDGGGGVGSATVPVLPSGAGVNPRALAELFRLKAEREAQGMADVEVGGWVGRGGGEGGDVCVVFFQRLCSHLWKRGGFGCVCLFHVHLTP
jgi:hypothetical protein